MITKQPMIHAIGNQWLRHSGEGKGVASSNGEEPGRLSGGGGIWLEGLLVCSYIESWSGGSSREGGQPWSGELLDVREKEWLEFGCRKTWEELAGML